MQQLVQSLPKFGCNWTNNRAGKSAQLFSWHRHRCYAWDTTVPLHNSSSHCINPWKQQKVMTGTLNKMWLPSGFSSSFRCLLLKGTSSRSLYSKNRKRHEQFFDIPKWSPQKPGQASLRPKKLTESHFNLQQAPS